MITLEVGLVGGVFSYSLGARLRRRSCRRWWTSRRHPRAPGGWHRASEARVLRAFKARDGVRRGLRGVSQPANAHCTAARAILHRAEVLLNLEVVQPDEVLELRASSQHW